jgi:hypothetical protein
MNNVMAQDRVTQRPLSSLEKEVIQHEAEWEAYANG